MKFGSAFEFETDSFTTAGPTPRFAAWLVLKDKKGRERPGFDVTFGFRPLRFAWNGVWVIESTRMVKR